MGKGPIFIAGVSYSGKTQLRLMLSAHPNIVITRRTYMWQRYYNRFGDLSRPENFERCLEKMLASKHIQTLNPDPERIRREFWQGKPSYGRLFALIHRHFAEQQGKMRWGDQHGSLENDADLIFSSDPRAVILHMVRNPLDRVEESLSKSKHRRLKIGWETRQWRRSSKLALRNSKKYPHRYKVVQCEQLFAYPEKTLRDICLFLGEEFYPEMLAVEELVEMGVSVPSPFVKGEQVVGGKSGRAQPQLTHTEWSFVQSQVNSEMSALGYPQTDQRLSFMSALRFSLMDYPLNLAGAILWETWGCRKLSAPKISFRHGS
jgi:hypothetical protein